MQFRAPRLLLATTLLAAAATSFAVPAAAQTTATSSAGVATFGWSKSDAILGAPSALAAITAQQQIASARAAGLTAASFAVPTPVPAIARDVRPAVAEGVASGRPDIFGSVALRVDHTPLDARWHHAESQPIGGKAGDYARALASETPLQRLKAVNHYVNSRVEFVDDMRQFGKPDVWSTGNDTLRRGRGDCEDYAIAKFDMLRRAGISDRDLYLVIVRDLVRREDHALLVVRADRHMYVLDNGTDEVMDNEQVPDYRPVLTFAANGAWTHGYRIQRPVEPIATPATDAPVAIAENDLRLDPPQPAAGDQRSRSASLLALSTGFNK